VTSLDIRHNKAYDHISELNRSWIYKKRAKREEAILINLTEKFYEYFDVDGSKDIREVFNKVVGITAPQTKVEDFEADLS
jgi:chromosome segregation and condensation protein ScpB